MAESFSKKPKLTPTRAQRIRLSIQLEVEAGMEERLEALKSKIQRVKRALRITSRTPMGNLLMMERLLSSFEEFERSQMATTGGQSWFLQPPSPQPFLRKKQMPKRKRKSLIRTFWLTVKIQPGSSISTQEVRRTSTILFRPTMRCETSYLQWHNMGESVLCVAIL